jgi:predicted dienelactone hydrolase
MLRRLGVMLIATAIVWSLGVTSVGATPPSRTYAVASTTFTFVDSTRATPANGSFVGAPTRTLSTLVLYPATTNGGPFPLVVFAHGFTASGPAYAPLLRQWAARGFVVAAPTFPLSSQDAPGGPTVLDYRNQPGDVSFVITEMLRESSDPHSPLHGLIARNRIAVAGHSLGAITTLAVAYNSCCQDARIDAAVPISGIMLPFGTGTTWFAGPSVPLLLIHGNADRTVPYVSSVKSYAAASAPKYFMTLEGAPHTPFFGPWGADINNAVVTFFDRYLTHHDSIADLEDAARDPGLTSLQDDPAAPIPSHGG